MLEGLKAIFTRIGRRDRLIDALTEAVLKGTSQRDSNKAVGKILKVSGALMDYMGKYPEDPMPVNALKGVVDQYRSAGSTTEEAATLALRLIQAGNEGNRKKINTLPRREFSDSLVRNIIEDISEPRATPVFGFPFPGQMMVRMPTGVMHMWIKCCSRIEDEDIRKEASEALLEFCENNRKEFALHAIISAIKFARDNMHYRGRTSSRDRMERLAEWVIPQCDDKWNYIDEETTQEMKTLLSDSREGARRVEIALGGQWGKIQNLIRINL